MIKKVTKIVILFAIIIFTAGALFADGNEPPPPNQKKGNFSKGNFSKKNAWSENGKTLTPPDPNSGQWGPTAPISNGLIYLIIGSVLYIIKRVREGEE